MKVITRLGSFLLALALLLDGTIGSAQTLDKIRLGNSGTGINTYLLDLGRCSASMASIWKRSMSAAARYSTKPCWAAEAKGKNWKFEDLVDLRVLRELEKEGFFK